MGTRALMKKRWNEKWGTSNFRDSAVYLANRRLWLNIVLKEEKSEEEILCVLR